MQQELKNKRWYYIGKENGRGLAQVCTQDSLKETWQGHHMYQLLNYHQGDTKPSVLGEYLDKETNTLRGWLYI